MRELRLRALQDPVAHLAFLDTHAEALARPDSFWQERTARASAEAGPGAAARQFVAVDELGDFVATAVALLERVGDADVFGLEITRPAGHLVGVYVASAHRRRGLIEALIGACLDWIVEHKWIVEQDRPTARLFVHEDNARARHVYEKLNFHTTGVSFTGPQGCEVEMERHLHL